MFDQFSFQGMKNRFSLKSQVLNTKIKTDIKSPKLPSDSGITPDSNPEVTNLLTLLDKAFEEL